MSTFWMTYHPSSCKNLMYTIRMKKLSDAVIGRLYTYMNEQELTQYKLAQLSGVPFPTIKSIMQRRTNGISLKTIILLSDGLGISPSEFLNDPSFSAENLDLD